MRLVRYLKGHLGAVALVFVLLVVLAYCDLALPNYTADIVDTGIQQGGIQDASPTVMSQRTFDAVAMMLPEDTEEFFRSCYDPVSEDPPGPADPADSDADTVRAAYQINQTGLSERARLNEAVAFPLVAVHMSSQLASQFAGSAQPDGSGMLSGSGSGSGATAGSGVTAGSGATASTGEFDLDTVASLYRAGLVKKDAVVQGVAAAQEYLQGSGVFSAALLEQQGVAAARAEYELVGYDVSQMQISYLLRTGLLMLGITLVAMVCNILVSFLTSRTGAQVARDLRGKVYSKVLSFSEAEVGSFSTASLITRCTNDIQLVQMVEIMFQRVVLYAPILAVGGIVMVSRTNVSMSWVIVLAVAAILLVVGVLFGIVGPKFKIMQKLIDRVNLVSREILTGLPVIRAFGREAHEEERFGRANDELMRTQLFTNRAMAFMMPSMMLIMNMTSVLIVWVGGHYIDAGDIQTGDLIAFITYTMLVVSSFLIIGMVAILLPRANVAAQRIDEVLATQPGIADPEPAACRDSELALTAQKTPGATVTFEDVCFAYADGTANVLDHVSFEAPAGKTTAVIGATGSGKSTVVKLVERFYDPTSGRVLVDGIDVRDLSQAALRSTLGYSPQKAFLFSGTVDSNVSFCDEDMPQERKDLAVEVAQAAEFVYANPDGLGLQAPIAQGGSNVSGGQRQRLSIARALASDARVYLFDDSFSALDYRTDARLRAEMAAKLEGRTVIIVAQRVATIMAAHQIVVLEEGRVVGCGTHDELLRTCPQYREIAESQLSEDELAKGGDR